MKIHVFCCLVYHKVSTASCFTYSQDVYKKDISYSFTLCTVDAFIHVCYECVYNMILIRRFDETIVNQTLNWTCHVWISYSSYYEKKHGAATNCFQNLKYFLLKEDDSIKRNHATTHCCF